MRVESGPLQHAWVHSLADYLGIRHEHCVASLALDADGAGGYQDDERFSTADVALVYQDFVHPGYTQAGSGEFVPGLSVIDALMNCGRSEGRRMIGSSLCR